MSSTQIDNYCDFYAANQRPPSIKSRDENERALGQWQADMQRADKLVIASLEGEQRAKILALNPAFFDDYDYHMQQVNSYCAFFAANQRHPKLGAVFPKEQNLAIWQIRLRLAEDGKGIFNPLDEKLKVKVLAVDPGFFL